MNRITFFSSGSKGTFYKTMGKRNERKAFELGMEQETGRSNDKINFNETCRRCRREQSQLVQSPNTSR